MSTEDDISRAVQSAVASGMTVNEFIRVARDCWRDELHDKQKYDLQEFDKALQPKLLG